MFHRNYSTPSTSVPFITMYSHLQCITALASQHFGKVRDAIIKGRTEWIGSVTDFFPWEMAVNDLPVLTLYTQRQLLAHPWVSLPAPLPPEVCATSSYFPLRKRQTNWLCQKDTQKLHSFHFRDLMASPIPFQTELELWHGTRMYLQTLKIILEPEATVFTAARKGREGTNPASLLFWGN